MKKEFILLAILGIVLAFGACKDKEEEVKGVTIYGTVIDKYTGEPLYNALVQERLYGAGSGVTGEDGSYEFTVPLPIHNPVKNLQIAYRSYNFYASKTQYIGSLYEDITVSEKDAGRRIKIDFQLECEVITYMGKVVDSQNRPIAGAKISATWRTDPSDKYPSSIGSTAISATDGTYTLMLPKPNNYNQWLYDITATQNFYRATTHTLQQHYFDMGKVISLDFILYD